MQSNTISLLLILEFLSVSRSEAAYDFSAATICAKSASSVLPHSKECQLYYNCSSLGALDFHTNEKYLMKCKYPDLFSVETLKCETFSKVRCGSRKEFKSACEYHRNKDCKTHCIPCEIQFPSCEGFADGIWPHPAKQSTPLRMVCFKERLVDVVDARTIAT